MTVPAPRFKIALAFLIVYLVWGSTYLAIRVGVESLPPALFAGVRFLISGLLLALYARTQGLAFPRSWDDWQTSAVVGLFLLVGGNGLVVWGEQWVPSNQAALIVASTALWIAALGTLGRDGQALTKQTLAGLAIGFAGVVVLLFPGQVGVSPDHLAGQLAILLASLLWASGSIYGKRRQSTLAPLMGAAMQMLLGGIILLVIGLAAGEPAEWRWTGAGMGALIYLILFGSTTYAVYIWLLHTVTPAQLGTYAYVNPAVAVVLGWWLLDERLSIAQGLGMLVIVLGVLLVSTAKPAAP